MRRTALLAAACLGLTLAGTAASVAEPLRLNVRPRSWLDAGNVTSPGSAINPASARGQMISYYLSPPWQNMRDRFGEGTLPDPIGGPFVGARNELGPVDLDGSFGGPGDW
ncbi:MAG: hypothetical protein JWQ36_3370 [Enterovirga sp.]|jgi:glycerol uptake facilitator-like aquaporin|nr:hypothetical protein [Enterovirga sp.]